MSANPQDIPVKYYRKESEIPNDAQQSVGGTIYSTTPGGTKIVYSRMTLLKYKESPLSCTPPPLNGIPEEILKSPLLRQRCGSEHDERSPIMKSSNGDSVFEMES